MAASALRQTRRNAAARKAARDRAAVLRFPRQDAANGGGIETSEIASRLDRHDGIGIQPETGPEVWTVSRTCSPGTLNSMLSTTTFSAQAAGGPEHHHPTRRNRRHLASLRVRCLKRDVDRYGCLRAQCFAGGADLGAEQARQDWAVGYPPVSGGSVSTMS